MLESMVPRGSHPQEPGMLHPIRGYTPQNLDRESKRERERDGYVEIPYRNTHTQQYTHSNTHTAIHTAIHTVIHTQQYT